LDALLVVGDVPAVAGAWRRVGCRVARLLGAQLLDLAPLDRLDRGLHVGEKLVHGLRVRRHLAAQDVVGEGGQPVQLRELAAQLVELLQDLEVLLPALVEAGAVVALARRLALRVLHERP
jgi:hypothetical protein